MFFLRTDGRDDKKWCERVPASRLNKRHTGTTATHPLLKRLIIVWGRKFCVRFSWLKICGCSLGVFYYDWGVCASLLKQILLLYTIPLSVNWRKRGFTLIKIYRQPPAEIHIRHDPIPPHSPNQPTYAASVGTSRVTGASNSLGVFLSFPDRWRRSISSGTHHFGGCFNGCSYQETWKVVGDCHCNNYVFHQEKKCFFGGRYIHRAPSQVKKEPEKMPTAAAAGSSPLGRSLMP